MEIKKFTRQGFLFSFRSTYEENGYATVSLHIDGDEAHPSTFDCAWRPLQHEPNRGRQ
ncbi:hypothetical protein [Prosthecochloris sp. GSB1]|uniref:hypothetical protein n=1 Tax=Prosthecochloris sp. GSB1 TaxID=281093 RepID=UPI0012947AD7|nr:hypothetical protein [Prosthecochloris sp. GSB1]